MSAQLKIQKEVKGKALIDLGANGSLEFEQVSVYTNGWSDKDLIMMIVDKNNPNHKIQLTFTKPTEFVEVPKAEEKPQEENTEETKSE